MNKLLAKISIFSLLMSATIYGWASHGNHACKSIVSACKESGYQKGGEKGKRLWKDCVIPVAEGKKQLSNAHFSKKQLSQCKKKLAKVKCKVKDKLEKHHKKQKHHKKSHHQKQPQQQNTEPQSKVEQQQPKS